MSSVGKVVDLTGKDTNLTSSRTRKGDGFSVPEEVWMLIYQMEAAYDCVGYWSKMECQCISPRPPETFDAKVLGIYTSKSSANQAAKAFCERHLDCDGEVDDYEGEGQFQDGLESGDCWTFSQRVFIQKRRLNQ
jgi:hypothetical protein